MPNPLAVASLIATVLLTIKTAMETFLQVITSMKQLAGEMEIPGWDKLEQVGLEISVELDAMIARLKEIPQTPA